MSLRDTVTPEEWQTRVELAACYRLVDYYDMSDMTGTHIAARVPGEPDAFLLNPYGLLFNEITASSLIKVNFDGEQLTKDTEYSVIPAGFTIHSAILTGREDIFCSLHTHTRAGMGVSTMECGLLPLTQHSMRFYECISYHDYEGVATNLDERERLQRDLGETNQAMILRNHGLLTGGRTISEAFHLVFRLEKACQAQVDAMSTGAELQPVPTAVAEHTRDQTLKVGTRFGDTAWPGHLRRLDRMDPSYKH
ncbi:MAG: class II aldolase/adducin family protein [Pseudomonadota bacterium]